MDKPKKSKNKNSFKVSKPANNITVSHKWTVIVVILSFVLSVAFSSVTSTIMDELAVGWAFFVLFSIILVNIVFDIVGTAVATAEETPFHSLASRKVKGAAQSVKIIRHAPQIANMCNDVIGDIAGIISGASTAIIVTQMVSIFKINGVMLSLVLTGFVGALTIGGKAFSKGVAMQNCNYIVFLLGKCFYYIQKLNPLKGSKKRK
ncbi:MAG: hypothetical protein N2171_01950 [Clostridia bacterium]|nr:hypothetical protein [Clostridia bacterium]